MNKKFLSAILFGALMVTSTGTFVSCKDYDDEIDNLQEQIDKKADLTELSSQVSSMQSAISAAQSEAAKALDAAKKADDSAKIAALEAKLNALETCKCDVDALKAELKETIDGAIADADLDGLKKQIEDQMAVVEELAGEYLTMVTSVSLYVAGSETMDNALVFEKITEKTNTFPASATVADKQYTFTAGNSLTETDAVIVRVSPTTAILQAENIALINSKGEELTDLVYVDEVEAYNPETPLYVPAKSAISTANNGLWKVTFKLKENYDATALKAATAVVKDDKVVGSVAFALAVNNTTAEEDAAARRVISSYDLTVGTKDGSIAANNFLVNGKSIADIHNRYTLCEDGKTSTTSVQELSWLDDTKPGTTAILKTEGDIKQNAENRPATAKDDRQNKKILPVVKGEPIKIQIDWNADKNEANNLIKGFYVTLDKNYALESVPSEINAWNSYEYENVGTDKVAAKLIDGNEGTITIKNLSNVAGDIIGFRVYAVNLDGTLLDPDGRAFYVYVGDEDSQSVIEGTVIATQPKVSTDYIAVPAGTFVAGTASAWEADAENVLAKPTITKVSETLFDVTYFDSNKKPTTDLSKVAYVKMSIDNVADLVDGETYTQTLKIYKSGLSTDIDAVLLKTVTAKLTKVMPTAFPEDFAFRPMQEETEGTGLFRAYMIPTGGYEVPTTTDAQGNVEYVAAGTKDLNNVFYGLDENYKFVFKTSALDKDNKPNASIDVTLTSNTGVTPVAYNMSVLTSFINNTTEHEVTAAYLYNKVSTYYDATAKTYKYAQAWEVAYDKSLSVIYSCWHYASTFAWGTKTETVDNKEVTTSLKPSLQWTATGNNVSADLEQIFSTNSYNNDFFGLDLKKLIVTNKWLSIKKDSPKLTVNGQTNPYFVPTIDPDGKITFTQVGTQVDAAPTADHDENFEFVVIDAYGHEKTISLAVTIKAPEKK